MTQSFHDRALAFEAKYAHDEEFQFRVLAHRDTLFAEWVAGQQRLSKPETDDLAALVRGVRDGAGHDEALLAAVRTNLAHHGGMASTEMSAGLAACADQARKHLLEHGAPST